MKKKSKKSIDGNTAAAHIAYALSEVCTIYPITPSSTMAELVDSWSAENRKNIFEKEVEVVEMQSEAGAAGAIHGILSAGALSSTFTSSQGLLLMIPNMYKIAGEIMPCVFHVAARALAGQALSIFGDHQDVMAARAAGFCMLTSASVQEAMDLALVAHLSTIRSSLPFLHFFDGFRTSHEIQKIEMIDYEDIKGLVDYQMIQHHRDRALNPKHPIDKGTNQNPDIYFQATEAINPFYERVPQIVEEEMQKVEKITGRKYSLFDYVGDPNAERIIIAMGSSLETIEETIKYLNQKGEKVGLIKVRLYRPFSKEHFLKALPKSVKKIAVLDRTKESGSLAEPLYLDIAMIAQTEKLNVQIVGGRYGLGSKDFTPSMVKAIYDNLKSENPKNHFTVGINDDVSHTSLEIKEDIDTEPTSTINCKFWGIGGDGTVGANKDAIKIIGDNTDKYVQGYFEYDSKKAGGFTVSHLRFGDEPIKSTYFINKCDYVGCNHTAYVKRFDLIKGIKKGGIFVLNSPWSLQEMEEKLPNSLKRKIAQREVKFYNVHASDLAKKAGLGTHINMIMQTIFFKLSNIIPVEKAIDLLKEAIKKTYEKKGSVVIEKNMKGVEKALEALEEIKYPSSWKDLPEDKPSDKNYPDYIKNIASKINAYEGDLLPVSAFTPGGIFPTDMIKYEKRAIASLVSSWIPENCIQCNQCSFVCPHAAIRPFLLTKEEVDKAPEGLKVIKAFGKGMQDMFFTIAITPYDCTGCNNCVQICPATKGKALQMKPMEEEAKTTAKMWDYLVTLPSKDSQMGRYTLKGSQFKEPLFEFSGACAGCGETPYIKLLTQAFGERMIVANATGCSSIYGGALPCSPWGKNEHGHGPAWANSLFEDNAEYGFGMQLATSYRRERLKELVEKAINENVLKDELKNLFQEWLQNYDDGDKSESLYLKIMSLFDKTEHKEGLLKEIFIRSDLISKPSVWIVGGDGWAYDIGYGGLDHVLAMGRDVNILVMDTELYSNTGGQSSKATPLGAIAKFASAGKRTNKKDLGLMAMSYGNVYVASVAMGYDKIQTLKAFKEAESYKGPSIIMAYSTCVGHGLKAGMGMSQNEEKQAVESGYWLNYRYDPRLKLEGKAPFQLDTKEPTIDIEEFITTQTRYEYLKKIRPEEAKKLFDELRQHQKEKLEFYKKLGHLEENSPK